MGKLITICPKCKVKNEIKNMEFMRLDGETTVICTNCSLRFRAVLSNKDIETLFKDGSVSPVVTTEENYLLKSELINLE